jgi:hypothetical protein
MLLPAVLARTWSRSAKNPTSTSGTTVLVQKVISVPLWIVTTGVSNQLLMVPTSSAFSKFAPI